MSASTFNPSYVGKRPDIVRFIPDTSTRILDVGCSVGILGKAAKEKSPNLWVTGIEIDEEMATIAREHLDEVIIADLDVRSLTELLSGQIFDCIIFADVLEHTKNPWRIMKEAVRLLSEAGVILTSIPNIRHISSIISLGILGRWPYRERGIHDKTHLRFFTRTNIIELLKGAGLEIITEKRNMRFIESGSRIDRFAKLIDLPVLRSFLTFQYIHVSKKSLPTG